MRRLNFAIATVFMIILSTVDELAAQVPSNLPAGDPEPLPFTPVNIIIYIVLPVALFVFYIWWLKQRKKKREEELREKAEENESSNQQS